MGIVGRSGAVVGGEEDAVGGVGLLRQLVLGDFAVPLVFAVPAGDGGEGAVADDGAAGVLVADFAGGVGEAEVAGDGVVALAGGVDVADAGGGELGQERVEVAAGFGERELGGHHVLVGGRIAFDHGAVAGFPDDVGNRLAAADVDAFFAAGEGLLFAEVLGGRGVAWADALAVDVPAVALRVGHGPGDAAVVAVVDGARVAGTARAGDVEIGAVHVHHVPLGRDAERKMGVAADDGRAISGVGGVDDPAVGAVDPVAADVGLFGEVGECVFPSVVTAAPALA